MEHTHALTPAQRIFRIGHRGAAGHAPENTLAAIRKGISLGVDFVELDVRRARDGRLVVMHDATVDRTTDGTGLVSEMGWDELRALDAGDGERVPDVAAALAEVNGHAGVMLEIKQPGIALDLCHAVRAAGFTGPVFYASFLDAEILEIRGTDPWVRTMALMESVPASAAALARYSEAWAVGLAVESANAGSVAALHDVGLEVFVYTVNEPRLIRSAIDLGVDGVISDYPERVPKMRSPGR